MAAGHHPSGSGSQGCLGSIHRKPSTMRARGSTGSGVSTACCERIMRKKVILLRVFVQFDRMTGYDRVGACVNAACACSNTESRRVKVRLDAIDWKILAELQADGRITNVELARRVGISAPPCLRRVRALEDAGVIRGYRALLDEKNLGFDVTAFAMVGLSSQSEADLVAFEQRVRAWTIVRGCWMLSGDIDFMLLCVAPDLQSFQNFIIEELTAAPQVDNVRTALTIRRSKSEGWAPLELR